MYNDNLPLKIDPYRFAQNGTSLQGKLLVKDMSRLCSSLYADEGEVESSFYFGIDEQGLKFVRGNLETNLTFQCQRCMEAYKQNITANFLLGLVHTEKEAEDLPSRYDPLIVSENELVLGDMVEDELIVALPIVSLHDPADCKVKLPFESKEAAFSPSEDKNPFKVIESLRNKRK